MTIILFYFLILALVARENNKSNRDLLSKSPYLYKITGYSLVAIFLLRNTPSQSLNEKLTVYIFFAFLSYMLFRQLGDKNA